MIMMIIITIVVVVRTHLNNAVIISEFKKKIA